MAHGSEVLHGFSGFMPIFRRCKQKIGGGPIFKKRNPSTTKPARQHWAGFAQILGRSFISLFNCSSWKKHSVKTKSEWRNMLKQFQVGTAKPFAASWTWFHPKIPHNTWVFSFPALKQIKVFKQLNFLHFLLSGFDFFQFPKKSASFPMRKRLKRNPFQTSGFFHATFWPINPISYQNPSKTSWGG